MLHSEVKILI